MTTPSKEPSSQQHQSTTTLQAATFHDDGYLHLPSLLTSPAFLSQLHTECLDIFHATLDWLHVSGAAEFAESVRLRSSIAAENIDSDDDTKEEEEVSDGISIRSVAAGSNAPKSSDKSSGGGDSNNNSSRYYEYPIKQGLKNGYRELVMRSDGRYELALLIDDDSRRSAKRSDVAKNDDGCNNYEEWHRQVDGSRMKGEQNDGCCYSDSYNGKRLMTVELIEQAKRQFLTAANHHVKNGELLCKTEMEECSGNDTTVKQMAAASRTESKTSTSCLQQILRWIQQYQVKKMDDDDDNSISRKNDNTTQDEEQNRKENIMDETNFQSFMELVSAIFQTDTNNHHHPQQQQQQHNSNSNDNDFYLCNLSLLISTPGSTTQPWHADGCHTSLTTHLPSHVFNVFIPLVDVPLSMGPTELRPGSHVYTRDLARMMLLAKVKRTLRGTVVVEMRRGDALVFDYRILHRGRANLSDADANDDASEDDDEDEVGHEHGGEERRRNRDEHDNHDDDDDDTSNNNKRRMKRGKDRPVLVLTFARRWFVDVCNFPKRSIFST